jgi:hypothetical protein
MAACDIDNAEPPHANPEFTIRVKALIIRAAMRNGPAHIA